eukprot:m.150826 g.150826  ORF g.150826 m.150826 type:complete len:141 (+) comp10147_c1_seq2:694-1116(+)
MAWACAIDVGIAAVQELGYDIHDLLHLLLSQLLLARRGMREDRASKNPARSCACSSAQLLQQVPELVAEVSWVLLIGHFHLDYDCPDKHSPHLRARHLFFGVDRENLAPPFFRWNKSRVTLFSLTRTPKWALCMIIMIRL